MVNKIQNNRTTILSIALLLCTFLAEAQTPKLTLLWETEARLPGVESVIYHPETNLIYTANINGNFMAKDGNGTISKVDLEGNIVDADWITGLDGPTGLGIYQGKLYVTDIDRLIEIDIAKGEILNRYEVPGAKAFNDITVSTDGTVYASDTGGGAIYALKNGVITTVTNQVRGANGLLAEKDRFLTVLWYAQTLYELNLETGALTELNTGIVNPDGIEAVGNGAYLLTGLNGQVYYAKPGEDKVLLIDTSGDKIQAADIDYIANKQLLLVPTLNSNKVMAYRLSF